MARNKKHQTGSGGDKKPRIMLVTGWTNPERRSIVEFMSKLLRTLEPLSSSLT
jgi:hypothetical protein